ncbi:MAG: hypothetical protein EXS14_01125 [Planctomycetes bacterium]|nr:hypothetical protein [Planctomycetota bacterium]
MNANVINQPQALAWIDGQVVAAAEARIPLEDRGVVFSEAAYEVLLARGARLYETERHLARFERSLRGVGIDASVVLPLAAKALGALSERAVQGVTALAYLHATGGWAPREHLPQRDPTPALYATWRAIPAGRVQAIPGPGIALHSLTDFRWQRSTWKTTQLLGAVQAKRQARDAGADEALFVGTDGQVLEASTQNVFMVRDGEILTPPLSLNLLPGVTRALILEVWPAGVSERGFTLAELREADEIFLASTTRSVLAVTRLDGKPVAGGEVGPVSRYLAALMSAHLLEALGPERE